MTPRILLQLAILFDAEATAIHDDPDDKLRAKDGWREHMRTDLRRPLSKDERHESDRLHVTSCRLFYRAHDAGAGTCGADDVWG